MSSRALRPGAIDAADVVPYDWGAPLPGDPAVRPFLAPVAPPSPPPLAGVDPPAPAAPAAAPAADASLTAEQQGHLAALERDAFTKGYAQGERAGLEAGGTRAEAMLRRMATTLDELGTLRTSMIHATEHQMVQLALAIARRILRREASLDGDLVIAMARVALDRLGERTPATVRLNPDDLAATGVTEGALGGSHVSVVADAGLSRGQCRVESEFGLVDAGVDAQFEQIAQALVGDATPASELVGVPHGL